jgi:guanine deaminase
VADLALWDWAAGPVATHRDAVARGQIAGLPTQELHARVFAWMLLGDERNLRETYIAGRRVQGIG